MIHSLQYLNIFNISDSGIEYYKIKENIYV